LNNRDAARWGGGAGLGEGCVRRGNPVRGNSGENRGGRRVSLRGGLTRPPPGMDGPVDSPRKFPRRGGFPLRIEVWPVVHRGGEIG